MAIRALRRLGCLGGLMFGLLVVLLVTAVLAPWSFHIGERWTAAWWQGVGMLRTEAGDAYPVYIYFFPNFRSMSRLRLNGQRPTSGLSGNGWLCSAQGVTQRLDLSGTIYGTYLNTDGNQMGIRLLDARRFFRINPQRRRYFDLYGRWHGPELVMGDDGGWERGFHPDPHDPKERAKVTFSWGSYGEFKRLCDETVIREKARIAPPRD